MAPVSLLDQEPLLDPGRFIPAPLRPRTHLPTAQTNLGLDPPEDPHHARGGPLDLAGHRRTHPAAPGPPAGRRSASALGETRCAGPADPRAGAPRVSAHPRDERPAGPGAQTQQARSGTPARLPQPP